MVSGEGPLPEVASLLGGEAIPLCTTFGTWEWS